MLPGISLFISNINSTSGDVVLRNSDVVLIAKTNSSKIELSTTLDSEMTDIIVNHDLCSEIGQLQQVSKSTSELTVSENMMYSIDEVYLIGTSQVTYNFTTVESPQVATGCVANVTTFLEYPDYMEFLTSGNARNPNKMHCLSPHEPLTFHLNSSDGDSYHFVGLKSFEFATLNYTVFKELLKYDSTNTDGLSCTLSTSRSDCTISLNNSQEQEACVLASLQDTNNTFISLFYFINHSSDVIFWLAIIFSILGFTV